MIQGVDVHAGYGPIDWSEAAKHVSFCWVKCSTGNDPGVDAQFHRNVKGCKENGVAVGGYHYAYSLPEDPSHPGRSPEEEAEKAFRDSGGLGSEVGELPHMVDAENPSADQAHASVRPQISESLRRYCIRATALWCRKPVIYTYPAWWRWLAAGADVSWAKDYLLIFADYDHPGPGMPSDDAQPSHWSWVSGTWDNWAAWQYSADGSKETIPGIHACPIDRECMRDGTLASLLSWGFLSNDMPIVHPEVPE